MGIITISRGSYSKGEQIAEKLASKLGYECISKDLILEASEHFNVPEVKLTKALHDAPSFFDRFTHNKEKYVAFIHETLLEHIQNDNIVYHGLAGHYLLRGIPNVLRVRIITDMEDRIKEEMTRENISKEEAVHILRADDAERQKWSEFLYETDPNDPVLYDIILHIDQLSVDDAVKILSDVSQHDCFKTNSETWEKINDELISAKAYIAIANNFPAAKVKTKDGIVVVSDEATMFSEAKISEKLKELLKDIGNIKEIRTNIIPIDL